MSLLSSFRKFIDQSACIPPGGRVLVGVSGGADSVALLVLLHRVADAMNLYLEAAHFDHSLREESCDDSRFVVQLCSDLGIHLTVEKQDVAEVARQRKGNLEEVARDLRRDFLKSTATAHHCQLVALGHHADDQAETFLMRLLRGSGPSGLAGMRLVNESVVRPLLFFRHEELLSYLQAECIPWREDHSNLDQMFTRNRIRHQLLPLLESYNPNISHQLSGLCELLGHDEDFWCELVGQELERCSIRHGNDYTLERSKLIAHPPALRGRVVRAALHQVRGDLRGVTSTHIAEVLNLVYADAPQGELNLPGAWVARRYEKLLLSKQKPDVIEYFEMVLIEPGHYPLPDGRILHVSFEQKRQGESADAVEFSEGSLSFPMQLRHWQPGDRIRPSGMGGSKKLQDLFVDLKMTREERQKVLVLLKDDEILWIIGLRRSDGRHPLGTEPVLRFVMQP